MRWIAPLVLCGRSLLSHNNPFRSGGHGLARAFSTGGLPLRSLRFRTTTTTTNPATTIAAFLLSASSSSSSSSSSEGGSPPIRRDRSTMISAAAAAANPGTGYLNATDAAALDEDLMSTPGFSLEQLMELAGLAVAEAVYECVPPPPSREDGSATATAPKKVVFVCGPGNNGGDGLVAARHLSFFGRYDISVVYPKRSTKRKHFVDLVKQCEDVGIPVLDELPEEDLEDCDALVDAIFGFSFRGEPREPFGTILRRLKEAREEKEEGDHRRRLRTLVLSVDVPSGWNVDEGDSAGTGFVPDVLVSLTAPKLCSKGFGGRHFVGGRFLPPAVASKYDVRMPPYPGVSQVMEVTREHIEGGSTTTTTTTPEKGSASASAAEDDDDGSWRAEYAAYLAEKEREANANADETSSPPSAAADGVDDDDDRKESVDDESWQEQYAAYCIEKEARLAEEDAKQREALRKEPK